MTMVPSYAIKVRVPDVEEAGHYTFIVGEQATTWDAVLAIASSTEMLDTCQGVDGSFFIYRVTIEGVEYLYAATEY